ncbi:hypothetical protein PO878_13670 [Iamia majanohamensis]|uniref:Uncharacterized protein n=1 Tax=Iamia majanohamensis TaxID=467976 RepID=A0AAE9Y3S9_9ACTN|nr:hypothetical protein [Iamia majanohamensis]WCO65547.1 hypothetical protein PO878_13670 [Iamia majanohamensis]
MRPRPALLLPVVVVLALLGCGHDEVPDEAVCRSRHRVPAEALAEADVAAVEMTYARCEPWFVDLCDELEDWAELTRVPTQSALVEGAGPTYAADVRDAVGAERLREGHAALLATVDDAEGSVAHDLETIIRGLPDGTPEDDDGFVSTPRLAARWTATIAACAPTP